MHKRNMSKIVKNREKMLKIVDRKWKRVLQLCYQMKTNDIRWIPVCMKK